tara:strand:+ start:1200 stop:1346 length:147 start_codon:yes stop_codon:yes gene_type:complete
MLFLAAAIRAIHNFFPVICPLFSPIKRALANWAFFAWKVLLFMGHKSE